MTRYSRQTRLPEWGLEGQERVSGARVLCVGAGGLGSPVALYLAAAGVGTLGLVDDDQVELSNLQRQVLFSESDLGQSKVEVAARRIRALNPGVEIRAFDERFESTRALEIARDFDLLVDCSDNFATKFLINAVACRLGKPWVYASVDAFEGQLALFDGGLSACYQCLVPEVPRAQIRNCAESGVIGAAVGVVGTMQALLALNALVASGDEQHPLYVRAGQLILMEMRGGFSQRKVSIQKRPACRTCSAHARDQSEASIDSSFHLVSSVSVQNFREALARDPGLQVLDVREESELHDGAISGATHWPLSKLQSAELPALDRARSVVLYCQSGRRSELGVQILKEFGFARPVSLRGGFDAWR